MKTPCDTIVLTRSLFICYGKCKRACTIQSAWEWRFARARTDREGANEWNEGADSRAGEEGGEIS